MADERDSFDDFWDISKLIPKKNRSVGSFSTDVKSTDFYVDAPKSTVKKETVSSEERKIDYSAYASLPSDSVGKVARSYVPKTSKLIRSVTIKPSVDRFDFYDTFRKAALIYYDYKCPKCDFAPFYSYKPQYSQMTQEQKKYYFFWRDEIRNGRYIKTDYSYLYLYAYEILNLPEKISPDKGLKLLCDVWGAYRSDLPRIDANFSSWIQDYCLVYELDCPYDEIKNYLFDVISISTFKEFYLSDLDKSGNGIAAMIAYLSDYDWRKCKYAGGDNADIYRLHIEGSMRCVFAKLLSNDVINKSDVSKISRTAFPGSLCTHSVKCILEVEYFSIASSATLRNIVTTALKYTENKLRAYLGVKSRLSIKDLPDEIRSAIDKYFEYEFIKQKRERAKANAPEYEKLYYAEETELSFESAIEIERASWKTTARLIEGSEEYEFRDEADFDVEKTVNVENTDEKAEENSKYGLSAFEIEYIDALCKRNRKRAVEICKENGVLEESLADRINEVFFDNFGDVILEVGDDDGYSVIDDYYEEIIEWLR